jgi:acetylornithine/succinyldiaminopimelate/putrescine aminotransferase
MAFARPNDVESLEAALAPAGDTALILLEPILGEGGVIPLEQAVAEAAAELAREVGALLCVDEVQTGCGRTGTFFAFEQLGVEPDLVTLAKGLANGLPIGAMLASGRAAAGFVPGDHGSTFGGTLPPRPRAPSGRRRRRAPRRRLGAWGPACRRSGAPSGGARVRGRGLLLAAVLEATRRRWSTRGTPACSCHRRDDMLGYSRRSSSRRAR